MWQMTRDMWHKTCDTRHVTGGGKRTFSKNFSSWALKVWEWRCFEDILTRDHWMNECISEWRMCLLNSLGYSGSVKDLSGVDNFASRWLPGNHLKYWWTHIYDPQLSWNMGGYILLPLPQLELVVSGSTELQSVRFSVKKSADQTFHTPIYSHLCGNIASAPKSI